MREATEYETWKTACGHEEQHDIFGYVEWMLRCDVPESEMRQGVCIDLR